ncbi:unnamed protein product [Pleuronectes platessa]|uniref:Uncharacterized protein n=1 Tax=Pleuronectes platessa TaxID=8262 RepID=A0A9N7Y9S7_PLEPL|nr:unnamed protein product [Pleuronectes platessa]
MFNSQLRRDRLGGLREEPRPANNMIQYDLPQKKKPGAVPPDTCGYTHVSTTPRPCSRSCGALGMMEPRRGEAILKRIIIIITIIVVITVCVPPGARAPPSCQQPEPKRRCRCEMRK